jgi:glycosyltransferase involved in cell wall biosynthesis
MLLHSYYLNDARVRRQAESLAAAGYEVHVVSSSDAQKSNHADIRPYDYVKGVHVHFVPLEKKRGNKFRYFFEFVMMTLYGVVKLARLHYQKSFDVVHIHNMPDILVLAGLIPRCGGAKIVLDIHDPMSELFLDSYHLNERSALYRVISLQEKICYRMATRLVTVSRTMAENVAKKAGEASDQIMVVHNFPHFPVYTGEKAWPYNRESLVLLYAGTVTEHYRLDIAVKAVAAASKMIPNIKLRILGGGNRTNQVLALAEELGVRDRVDHTPPVTLDRVAEIMRSADIGISTHQGGTFGDLYFSTKIIEFMSQGLPVVSSRTRTIHEYIPEEAIFYFDPGNVEDLVRTLLHMRNNPARVLEKIRASQDVVSRYSWHHEKVKLQSFYQTLTASR